MVRASRFSLGQLEHPVVQAPLAGGPSTPALAVAVAEAGGLAFVAAGYRTAEQVEAEIADVRARTARPFGVNLFVPDKRAHDGAAIARYVAGLAGEARRYRTEPGEPRHDDDRCEEKLAVVARARVPVVSFTFGCPEPQVSAALREAGAIVWVTVTTPSEAVAACEAGADGLVVQGVEAGGHRGSFDDATPGEIGLLALLQLVGAEVDVPLVASGGIATGRGIAAVLAAGAGAAQLGSAFLRTPEAGTSAPHREALAGGAATALTRAFTGRTARGIINRFMNEHHAKAPSAYPEIYHATAPLRAAARAQGDADGLNLWAGQAHALAVDEPAGDLVRRLGAETREALREALRRLDTVEAS
jgi:nitronate monooxygenase